MQCKAGNFGGCQTATYNFGRVSNLIVSTAIAEEQLIALLLVRSALFTSEEFKFSAGFLLSRSVALHVASERKGTSTARSSAGLCPAMQDFLPFDALSKYPNVASKAPLWRIGKIKKPWVCPRLCRRSSILLPVNVLSAAPLRRCFPGERRYRPGGFHPKPA